MCRSCGHGNLQLVLSLGRTPLANALLAENQLQQPEDTYPLDLVFCPQCSLVQITETVPPERLFAHYLYFTSFSDTMVQYARELAARVVSSRHLDAGSLVVELASNDGYLLQFYRDAGVPVLGIEPATNIAEEARRKGIRTMDRFFGSELASELKSQGMLADVVHANNVLAHVADLNGFVGGIATILKPEGVAIIEVPYVRTMVEALEFDTIYHEHLCYFSLTALDALFTRHGLHLVDVETLPIHGGTLRISVQPRGAPSEAVRTMLEDERKLGMDRFEFYARFGDRVRALRNDLRSMLEDLKRSQKSLAAYGASAKGSTLLNFMGIGSETLDFVVDRSTVKQGLYTPGTHLPILPPAAVLDRKPDYLLLLVWNFEAEVLRQQEAYRQQGGKFIIPVPQPKVV